jgi:hypothetical protein
MLHGPPKVGKTTMAASFPEPNIFIATEPGHKWLKEEIKSHIVRLRRGKDEAKYRGSIYSFKNGWEKLMWFLEEGRLVKTKAKTITVDTVGPLYDMCMDYVCQINNLEHPSDASHGKGWNALAREFAKGLGMLAEEAESLGATLLFIAHSKQSEITAGARTYSRIEVSLTGHARGILLPAPDHIWYLGYHSDAEDSMVAVEDNRALWLQPTPVIEAGGRNPGMSKQLKFISGMPDTGQYKHILKKLQRQRRKQSA